MFLQVSVCPKEGGLYPSMPCRSHDQQAVYMQLYCYWLSVSVETAYRLHQMHDRMMSHGTPSLGRHPLGGHPLSHMFPCHAWPPPWDMVNEQAVHNLLECILVFWYLHKHNFYSCGKWIFHSYLTTFENANTDLPSTVCAGNECREVRLKVPKLWYICGLCKIVVQGSKTWHPHTELSVGCREDAACVSTWINVANYRRM